MSEIELKDEIVAAIPKLPWRDQLRLAWRTPIVIVAVAVTTILIYPLGVYWGTRLVNREPSGDVNQRRAWDAQVAVFNKCFDGFVKYVPRSKERLRRGNMCFDVSEVALNGVYEAGVNHVR